jgi:hypothetical protein
MIEGAGNDDWRVQREEDRAHPFPTDDNITLDPAIGN